MAIALDSSTAWVEDTAFNANVTSGSFSPGAGTVLVAVVASYNRTSPTITNSGTALTWTLREAIDNAGYSLSVYTAPNSSAQSNITVTFEDLGTAYPIPALKVFVFSGMSTSSPVGTKGSGASGLGTTSVAAGNTTVADAWTFTAGFDTDLNGLPSMTGEDAEYGYNGTYVDAVVGYKALTTVGSDMALTLVRSGTLTNGWRWVNVELKPGGTTHDASASRSTTATTTATVTADRAAAAAPSHTATVTAAAALDRSAAASSAVSATLTAAATVERVGGASLASTATLTAAADVSNPNATASLASTATLTAAAAVETMAGASLSVSAAVSAAADLATVHDAAAARVVTVSISASAAVLTGGVGDPGVMTLADIARATMKPAGSTAATMRTVLVGFNTATMQAVLDDAASMPLLGVPVFVGDDDPVTLGLIALTSPHVWFHDGTVTVREG